MVVQLFNGLEMDFVMTQLILLNAIMMEVIVVLTPMFRVSVPYVFVMMIDKIKKVLDVLRTLQIRCGRVMADNIAYAKFRKSLLI